MSEITLLNEPFLATDLELEITAGHVYGNRVPAKASGWLNKVFFTTGVAFASTCTSVHVAVSREGPVPEYPTAVTVTGFAEATYGSTPGTDKTYEVQLPEPVFVRKGEWLWIEILPIGGNLFLMRESDMLLGNGIVESARNVETTETKLNVGVPLKQTLSKHGAVEVARDKQLRMWITGEGAEGAIGASKLTSMQLGSPHIVSLWQLGEAEDAIFAKDEVSQQTLSKTGVPSFGNVGLARRDPTTSLFAGYAQGGSAVEHSHLSRSMAAKAYKFFGLTIEALTAAELNGKEFELISLPSQFKVTIKGKTVAFMVKTAAEHTLTATNVLAGYPQHLVCVLDTRAEKQYVYVDGVKVAEGACSASVNSGAAETLYVGKSISAARTEARIQNLAVYVETMPAQDVQTNFEAARYVLPDPVHVRS
jgi:Concanavalin A-like lectin/glucanases superfamily